MPTCMFMLLKPPMRPTTNQDSSSVSSRSLSLELAGLYSSNHICGPKLRLQGRREVAVVGGDEAAWRGPDPEVKGVHGAKHDLHRLLDAVLLRLAHHLLQLWVGRLRRRRGLHTSGTSSVAVPCQAGLSCGSDCQQSRSHGVCRTRHVYRCSAAWCRPASRASMRILSHALQPQCKDEDVHSQKHEIDGRPPCAVKPQ